MQLLKGDWDSLEGRAIIYSKFKQIGEPIFIGDGIQLPDGHLFALRLTLQDNQEADSLVSNIVEEVRKELQGDQAEVLKSLKMYPVIAHGIAIKSESAILNGVEDVLYTGEFSLPQLCFQANTLGVNYYSLKLVNKDDKGIELIPSEPRYHSVPSDRMREYLVKEYISGMIGYATQSDEANFNALERRFLSFAKNSTFEIDAVKLSDIITNNRLSEDQELIDWYLDRIVVKRRVEELQQGLNEAVESEKYELAETYKNRIADLKQTL
ncbi:MAG: UvrB/UvrC motif-containing protein [Candidatus Woesearchaeota archaeon]